MGKLDEWEFFGEEGKEEGQRKGATLRCGPSRGGTECEHGTGA